MTPETPPPLFFYGTLLDDDMFDCVLQAPKSAVSTTSATLADHLVTGITGLPYPMLEKRTGETVSGLLIENLSQAQFDRVCYYEGIDYALVPIEVKTENGRTETAQIFEGVDDCISDGEPWSLALWQAATKPLSLAVLREVAPLIGVEPLERVEAKWNEVERRLISEGMEGHRVGGTSLER